MCVPDADAGVHHLTLVQYARRCLLKVGRYIKLRTTTSEAVDMALQINRNPLRQHLPVPSHTHEYTLKYLASFRSTVKQERAHPAE